MSTMMAILRDLTPLNRVFCSSDYDRAISYLSGLLPFQVIEYAASDEHNGWVIPPRWDVEEAKIVKDGSVIYDGLHHPLAVIALSKSFQGVVGLDELKRHLHYDHRYEDAIPYHFRQEYRSWERDWGFCVPKRLYDSLEPGEYEVIIRTRESEGVLKVLDYTHKGSLEETIVFAAHLDHPGMANDDLAGCAVGVELFRRLRERKTRFSYKLFLHQEIIGSEYYLARTNTGNREKILEGLFLEMLGTETELGLQAAPAGYTNVEHAVARAMEELGVNHRRGAYGDIVVNGEYVWQAYGIAVASLSRYPYPEYHCDRDNVTLMSERALHEAVDILVKAVDVLESTRLVSKRFKGTICVSNPRFDLYVDPGQAAFGGFTDNEQVMKMRFLMDLIPSLHRPMTVSALAQEVGLPEAEVLSYLNKWAKKGLLVIM